MVQRARRRVVQGLEPGEAPNATGREARGGEEGTSGRLRAWISPIPSVAGPGDSPYCSFACLPGLWVGGLPCNRSVRHA